MSALPPPSLSPSPGGQAVGSISTTQPVPNRGAEAMAIQGVSLIVKLMGELVPKSSSNPELQNALMDSMRKLSKFTSASGSSPGAQQQQMRELMLKQQQMSQLPQAQPPKPPGA